MNRFFHCLTTTLPGHAKALADKYDKDTVLKRVINEYGSVLVTANGAVPPDQIIFKNEREVEAFQTRVNTSKETIGGYPIELQSTAMEALKTAMADAVSIGLTITPRGSDSAKRSYGQTVALWLSRVEPGLEHWVNEGSISSSSALRIRSLSPHEQVTEILSLEAEGFFFSKDLSKSIMYSVAPPGTSQHLSMLALDVAEFNDVRVREILQQNGWFQTVISDLPHFTYLGLPEAELASRGLTRVSNADRPFWIPDTSNG
jgi:hypothetical protein